jgi:hypothetical protein
MSIKADEIDVRQLPTADIKRRSKKSLYSICSPAINNRP